MRTRRGFTLLEMSITLAVMAVASMLVVPALVHFGQVPAPRTADALVTLLRASRDAAISRNITVSVIIDPLTGKYRVDSTGNNGAGPLTEGKLELGTVEEFETDLPRLQFVFRPTGAALADSVKVRGVDSSIVVRVDPWSGVAHAGAW